MSILIKGIEMPNSCHVCVAGYGGCCYVAPPEEDGICPDHGRAGWCPIVPVPPHGRLIDADAIPYNKIMIEDDDFYYGITQPYIERMPTIIEAEEGE